MNIEDSLEAPLARVGIRRLADFAAARGRLGRRTPHDPRLSACSVLLFPSGRPSSRSAPAANRGDAREPSVKGSRWRGPVALLLPVLSAALCGWQSQARQPTDAQLIAVVRKYGANLPHPCDPTAGRAVRVEQTAKEWLVTLIDPRRLDPPRRHYVSGSRSAYHIDRATLRVVAVVIAD